MLRSREKITLITVIVLALFLRTSLVRAANLSGIDVSNNNGTITESDWLKVAGAGYTFAFVKATEGTSFEDANEPSNMSFAADAGIKAGVYDFADPVNVSPTAEAQFFVNYAKDFLSNGRLLPVLDLEQGGGVTENGGLTLTTWVNDYCAEVKTLTGLDPIIYTNTNYSSNFLTSAVAIHKLWVANYGVNNGSPDENDDPATHTSVTGVWNGSWVAWQYTSVGSVNGLSGHVDLDELNGSTAALNAITIGMNGNDVQFAVPEPCSLGLGMLTALGLLRCRARRVSAA